MNNQRFAAPIGVQPWCLFTRYEKHKYQSSDDESTTTEFDRTAHWATAHRVSHRFAERLVISYDLMVRSKAYTGTETVRSFDAAGT